MTNSVRSALAACILGLVLPALAAEEKAPSREALEKAEVGAGVFSKMIGGKEWRVEPIAGTKNFKVTWGDETVTWTPKPWQPKELQEKGPRYYYESFADTPYPPINISMDERTKQEGYDVMRGWSLVENGSTYLDWKGGFCFDIIAAGGGVRTRCGIEWKKTYVRPEHKAVYNSTDPPTLSKRFIVLTAPRTVRGVGFVTRVYDHPTKEQDNWLYLPSVRKVRRLATASKQDYFAGTPLRNEDLPQVSPYNHNYKVERTALFADPGPQIWGFGNSGWEKKEEFLDGIGCPHWVVETTPKEPNYWFAKKTSWVNMFIYGISLETAYDEKGEVSRVTNYAHRPADLIDPSYPRGYLIWTMVNAHDVRTGYRATFWGAHHRKNVAWEESFFDTQYSEEIFNPDLLPNEYTSTLEFGPNPPNWVKTPDPWPQEADVITGP
ncbi:MAG: outer membrane lipoprotein-sorting protein [Candidatus Binatia bacterium]